MDEAALFEQIGRQAIALAEKQAEITQCVAVIHGIKTGTINLDQLVTTETSFSLTPASVEELLTDK